METLANEELSEKEWEKNRKYYDKIRSMDNDGKKSIFLYKKVLNKVLKIVSDKCPNDYTGLAEELRRAYESLIHENLLKILAKAKENPNISLRKLAAYKEILFIFDDFFNSGDIDSVDVGFDDYFCDIQLLDYGKATFRVTCGDQELDVEGFMETFEVFIKLWLYDHLKESGG